MIKSKEDVMARPRTTVSFDEDVFKKLSDRAEKEVRTVANLVEYLVLKMLEVEEQQQQDQKND
ncbi:hypothetical protein [Leptolyngbya sp. ST-U4]|uniref:ribbon-helix-helix domain-containing protein n=1 Tax=Leptolyngbya sp. ST-U4 TaxID=2933912 RepID=UPI00329692DE